MKTRISVTSSSHVTGSAPGAGWPVGGGQCSAGQSGSGRVREDGHVRGDLCQALVRMVIVT